MPGSMKFEAVIFDLFGTLVDGFLSWAGPMHEELIAALGVPREPFMQLWRKTLEMRTTGVFQTVEASIEHVCGAIGAQVSDDQMTQAVEVRLRHTRRALEPRPNVVATLTRLKYERYRLGLLSNCSIEIPILWQETEFAALIDHPIFSSQEHLKKPDPRIYHLACERIGAAPQNCLYVADGENHELKAAGTLGIHPVLIRTPSEETRGEVLREAREWQGDTIFTLSEVLRLLGLANKRS
jgi:putative hydrolase of the HAD superfamily